MLKNNVEKINTQIFRHDNLRKKLISRGDINGLLDTYKKSFDIKNFNSGNYWDKVLSTTGNLKNQSPMTKNKIELIARAIPKKQAKILDLGIGQGFLEEIIESKGLHYKLFGIDISPLSIARATKLFQGKFIVGNVLHIDKFYKKKFADVIVALELLEHISPSQIFYFYHRINSILKDDGLFILSIPINEGLQKMTTNPSAHVRDYSFSIIKTELELNGFKIEKKYALYAFGSYYKIKSILSKFIRNRWKPNSLVIVARKIKKRTSKVG